MKVASAAERSLWTAGTLATIAGFGVTEADGEQPDVLQEARVPIVADEDAAEAYPYLVEGVDPVFGGFESETQVAAGFPQGGVDTCQGDSGGPLLVSAGTAMRLVGDTSYGVGCAEPGFPGVYGRLADATLREWITLDRPRRDLDRVGFAQGSQEAVEAAQADQRASSPRACTGSARRRPPAVTLQAQSAAEDLLHDLVGAAADRAEAGVAQRALDPVLAHVAVAAEDLHALVGDLDAGALGEQLRLRDLGDRVLAGDEAAQGVVGERPRRPRP